MNSDKLMGWEIGTRDMGRGKVLVTRIVPQICDCLSFLVLDSYAPRGIY